jgi:hypothetical protein
MAPRNSSHARSGSAAAHASLSASRMRLICACIDAFIIEIGTPNIRALSHHSIALSMRAMNFASSSL